MVTIKKKEQAYFAAVRSDLKVFLRHVCSMTFGSEHFLDNWHLDAIVYALLQAIEGKNTRLIINLPPRHLKSFITSVVLPAFVLGNDPTAKIICVSYSDDLAKTFSLQFKRIVTSEWYQAVFPEVRFVKSTEGEFVTDKSGFRYATSVGGTLTGRGGDIIIVDDPIKPDDAKSEKARNAVNEWFKSTLLSRLDDKALGILIIVMQRIHVNDLTGFVEAGGNFRKLSVSAIAIQDEDIPVGPGTVYKRMEGEALHPERESIETLEGMRDQVGAFTFAAQYQQTPETPSGSLLKRKWFTFIPKRPDIRDGFLTVSIDTALSTSDTADYTAINLMYHDSSGHFVLQVRRGRWDYEELKAIALGYSKKFGPDLFFIVEAAGTGFALTSFLRQTGRRCITSNPKSDKYHRVCRVLPIMEAKRVYIVDEVDKNAWVEPFINELVSFPDGRFDDQVDSLTQALQWAGRQFGHVGDHFGNAA